VITFPQVLAEAYISPARSIMLPSSPGRQVRFMGGHATIKDGRDMVALLRNPDVRLIVTAYAMNWYPQWVEAARTVRANVQAPEVEYVEDGADSA